MRMSANHAVKQDLADSHGTKLGKFALLTLHADSNERRLGSGQKGRTILAFLTGDY